MSFSSSEEKCETKVIQKPNVRDENNENTPSLISRHGVVFMHPEVANIPEEEWLQSLYDEVSPECICALIPHSKSIKVYFTDIKYVTNILNTGIFIHGIHLNAFPLVATITVSSAHPTLCNQDLSHIFSSFGTVIDIQKVSCLSSSSHSSTIWNSKHQVTFEIPHDAQHVYIPQRITEHSGKEYELRIKMHCIRCDKDGHNELHCPGVSLKEGLTKVGDKQLPALPSEINIVPNHEMNSKRKFPTDTNKLCESLPKHRLVSKNTARKSFSSHQNYSLFQQKRDYSEYSSSSNSNDCFVQSSTKSSPQSYCITNNLESPVDETSVNIASEYWHHKGSVYNSYYSLPQDSESTSGEDTDSGGSESSCDESIEKTLNIPCDILGPLTQTNLARFLREVKNATDQYCVALRYTKDIHGLIRQLCMLHAIKLQMKCQDTLFIWRLRDLIKRLERGEDPISYQTLLQTYRRNKKSDIPEISCSSIISSYKNTKSVLEDSYSENGNSSSKDNDEDDISSDDQSHQSSSFSTSIEMKTQLSKALEIRSSSNDESVKTDVIYPLSEKEMKSFLRKVKHAREPRIVALKYTSDISGLISQLDVLRERVLKDKTKEGNLLAKRVNDLVMKLSKGNSSTSQPAGTVSCFYVEEFANLKDATDPVPSSCSIPGPLDRENLLSFLLKVKFVKHDIYPIALQFTQDISGLIHQLDTLRTIKLNNRCYKNTLFIRRLTDLITKLRKGHSMATELPYIKSDEII